MHFYEHRMTGNQAEWRWKKEDENCIVTIANRGQEFVIHDDEQAIDWAKNLIMNNA